MRVGWRTVRLGRDGRVRIPVSCPAGCRASIAIDGRGRYGDVAYQTVGAEDTFEAPKGQTVRVPIRLGNLRKRYGRRTIRVRLAVRINPYRVAGAVKYLKLKI